MKTPLAALLMKRAAADTVGSSAPRLHDMPFLAPDFVLGTRTQRRGRSQSLGAPQVWNDEVDDPMLNVITDVPRGA